MAAVEASLDALLSGWGDGDLQPFRPQARYYESMDCVIYLLEDLPYRADRIDAYLTLLWHPHEDTLIGVKLKGFRWIFGRWVALQRRNLSAAEPPFVPLMKAIEVALTARLGQILGKASDADDGPEMEEIAQEQQRTETSYRNAVSLVDAAEVDASELLAAA